MALRFEWDKRKADSNLRAHRVSFHEATIAKQLQAQDAGTRALASPRVVNIEDLRSLGRCGGGTLEDRSLFVGRNVLMERENSSA